MYLQANSISQWFLLFLHFKFSCRLFPFASCDVQWQKSQQAWSLYEGSVSLVFHPWSVTSKGVNLSFVPRGSWHRFSDACRQLTSAEWYLPSGLKYEKKGRRRRKKELKRNEKKTNFFSDKRLHVSAEHSFTAYINSRIIHKPISSQISLS